MGLEHWIGKGIWPTNWEEQTFLKLALWGSFHYSQNFQATDWPSIGTGLRVELRNFKETSCVSKEFGTFSHWEFDRQFIGPTFGFHRSIIGFHPPLDSSMCTFCQTKNLFFPTEFPNPKKNKKRGLLNLFQRWCHTKNLCSILKNPGGAKSGSFSPKGLGLGLPYPKKGKRHFFRPCGLPF